MRRKDRQMPEEFGVEIVDNSQYGVLSFIDKEGKPYGIPLSLVRDGKKLYFHSAKSGKKVDALKDGDNVSVSFVGQVNVPHLFTSHQLKEIADNPKTVPELASKVFTTEFESAYIEGKISRVKDKDEMIHGLRQICEKYTGYAMEHFPKAMESGLAATAIYRIDISLITAKRKKFDTHGVEMKHGRMRDHE